MSLILMAVLGVVLLSNKLPVATVAMTGALICGMLAMVAQWMNLDSQCANAVAPLLVSTEQGRGSTVAESSLMSWNTNASCDSEER